MVRTLSYKMTDLDTSGDIDYAEVGSKTSETYFDVHLGKGDEIADRSFNFAGNGTTLKSKSVMEYGTITTGSLNSGASGSSAKDTTSSDAVMVRTLSYKLLADSYTAGTKLTSETYFDVHLGKGDEIADRSFNYAGDGTTLKSKSVMEYGTITTGSNDDGEAGSSAQATTSSDAVMVRTLSYKLLTPSYTAGTKLTSETYFDVHLGKGDEIADRSFNYAGDGATLKSKSVMEYGTITTGSLLTGLRVTLPRIPPLQTLSW